MKVIILAGGKATRMPNSAKDKPKLLVEVSGKPIIEHRLEWLKKYGLEDIRFSLGHFSEKIIGYLKGRYEYVIEKEPLGTGGAIKFACQDLKDDFIVINGDEITNIDLAEFIRFHQEHHFANSLVGLHLDDARGWGLIKNKGMQVLSFEEKPSLKQPGLINAGTYILSPKSFQPIKKKSFSVEYDVFPHLVKDSQLAVFIHQGKWFGINTEEDIKGANNFIKNLKQS
jgi:NDP-sugar pyrophosphorylase family protein